jgi:alkylated DNA repair dioxygenase AlkB
MGASFGDSRELEFLHEGTDARFKFPQNNGDIFAFTSDVNKKFMHGVPKASATKGPRFSIIAWGRRRNPPKE